MIIVSIIIINLITIDIYNYYSIITICFTIIILNNVVIVVIIVITIIFIIIIINIIFVNKSLF